MTPSGFASTATTTTIAGMETPDTIELRKDRRGEETPTGPKALYSVIPTKEVRRRTWLRLNRAWATALMRAAILHVGGQRGRGTRQNKLSGFMGSAQVYDLSGARPVREVGLLRLYLSYFPQPFVALTLPWHIRWTPPSTERRRCASGAGPLGAGASRRGGVPGQIRRAKDRMSPHSPRKKYLSAVAYATLSSPALYRTSGWSGDSRGLFGPGRRARCKPIQEAQEGQRQQGRRRQQKDEGIQVLARCLCTTL